MEQTYTLTIWNLSAMDGGVVSGGQAVFAIMDGEQEIDRLTISGKFEGSNGYRRSYTGKPDITAQLLSAPESTSFAWDEQGSDPYQARIVWRRRVSNPPERDPAESDVQDGRAEYVLSGPYSMGEMGRIEVVKGQLLFSGGSFKIT